MIDSRLYILITVSLIIVVAGNNNNNNALAAADKECLDSYPDNPEICDLPGNVNCTDLTVKDITVSGSDPFDLDRDGNGVGCES